MRQAAETETTLLVTLALRYLRTRFQAPIPEQVFTDLGHNTVSDLEAASLTLALVPWGHRVPWTQAEPVLRAQVRLHAARDPTRPILVLLPWESWTPEQTRVCESIGAVPIVRANGLPAAWQSTVQGYLKQHAAAWVSTLRAHYASNPRESVTFAVRLVGPDHGEWRVVFRTTPPATGDIQQWSPHLDVVESLPTTISRSRRRPCERHEHEPPVRQTTTDASQTPSAFGPRAAQRQPAGLGVVQAVPGGVGHDLVSPG